MSSPSPLSTLLFGFEARVPPGVHLRSTSASDGSTLAEGRARLTDDERATAEAFRAPDRRVAYVLGREAARRALAEALGLDGPAIPLWTAADGAPESLGAHVSIAHAGRGPGIVAVAAASAAPVGVDLERIGPRRADLHARLLGPSERGVLDALGGPSDDSQTLLWALKEAVLKGQRTGFRAGARSVRLSLSADGTPPTAGVARAVADLSGGWTLAYARVEAEAFGAGWLAVAWADPA